MLEEKRTRAIHRAGGRDRLPLGPPRLDLDWTRDDPPSELLRPRYGVVDFIGRESLLDHQMLWREGSDRLGVAILGGPGGFGKTRTAIELCLRTEAAGWTAGLLRQPRPQRSLRPGERGPRIVARAAPRGD